MYIQAVRKLFGQIQAIALNTLKVSLHYFATHSEQDTVIEVRGGEFVVWRPSPARNIDRVNQSSVQPLNVASLKTALRQFEYSGEQVSLILHPPCVCLKSFPFPGDNPDKWLAAHLVEIAPPGNRRDLAMCFRQWQSNHLLVAFVRRSFLSELADLLQQSRISVKGIYVGGSVGVNILTKQLDKQSEQNVDFSLCRYAVACINGAIQILPRPITNNAELSLSGSRSPSLESQQSAAPSHMSTSRPASVPLTTQGESIDFRPQISFPRALSSTAMRNVVRSESALLLALLVIVTLLHTFRTTPGSRKATTDYRLTESSLLDLRQMNEQMAREFDLAANWQRPRFDSCNFLKAVALATPAQTWLTSICYRSPTSGAGRTFDLKGLSLNRDEPLRFADSLRNIHDVRFATVTKAKTEESPSPGLTPEQPPIRLTKFEVMGEYANK